MSVRGIGSSMRLGLFKWQQFVWNRPERHKVIAAGRRSGKTELLFKWTIAKLMSMKERGEGWVTGPTYRQIKAVCWNRVLEWLEMQPVKIMTGKNETELRIDLEGGRRFYFKGLDKADSLRGTSPLVLGMSECAYHDEAPWNDVLRKAIADKMSPVMFESTPRGRNWFMQLARWGGYTPMGATSEKLPDWLFVRVRTEDVGTVDPDELRSYREGPTAVSPDDYAQDWEAKFLDYIGLVIPEFFDRPYSEGGNRISVAEWQKIKPGCVTLESMDWGMGSDTVVEWFDVDRFGRCIFFSEYVTNGKNLKELSLDIKSRREGLRWEGTMRIMRTIMDRMMWRREYDGNQIAAQLAKYGIFGSPSDSRFEDSREKLRQMCLTEPIADDPSSPMPRFMIVEGRCPVLTSQMKTLEIKNPEAKGNELLGKQKCDAFDTARYGVMQGIRGSQSTLDVPFNPLIIKRKFGKHARHGITGVPMRFHG